MSGSRERDFPPQGLVENSAVVHYHPSGDALQIAQNEDAKRTELWHYLQEGNPDASGDRYVFAVEIRDKLLRSGHTKLALLFNGYGVELMSRDPMKPFEEHPIQEIIIIPRTDTIKDLPPKKQFPNAYNGITAAMEIILNNPPDDPPGKDMLQNYILGEIDLYQHIRERLMTKDNLTGHTFADPLSWRLGTNGQLLFRLNAPEQSVYRAGWYTVDDFVGFIDGDDAIFRKNTHPQKEELKGEAWIEAQKNEYRAGFGTLINGDRSIIPVDVSTREKLRDIILCRCPFEDVRKEFEKKNVLVRSEQVFPAAS